MKPKLKDLDNVVIDCGDNYKLREVVIDHVWGTFAVPSKGQGVVGITPYHTLIKINDGRWETSTTSYTTPTHHINDIEL